MAIEKAQNHQPGVVNLTWGTFMKNSIYGFPQNAETLPIFNSASAQQ